MRTQNIPVSSFPRRNAQKSYLSSRLSVVFLRTEVLWFISYIRFSKPYSFDYPHDYLNRAQTGACDGSFPCLRFNKWDRLSAFSCQACSFPALSPPNFSPQFSTFFLRSFLHSKRRQCVQKRDSHVPSGHHASASNVCGLASRHENTTSPSWRLCGNLSFSSFQKRKTYATVCPHTIFRA